MKICPKCNSNLPEEAHFCPRCMYEYPRMESLTDDKKEKEQNRSKRNLVVAAGILAAVFLILVLGIFIRSYLKNNLSKEEAENRQQELIFQTIENNIDSNVEYDLKDDFDDFEKLKAGLGEETREIYEDGKYQIHTFEDVEIAVDESGKVKDIYIDYVESENKNQYGIYGYCGTSTLEEIENKLGIPNQKYGEEEYIYRFEGMENAPTLRFIFSSTGTVDGIEYYYQ